MITRSSITMAMLNEDLPRLEFYVPIIGKLSLTCATSPYLQSNHLTLGCILKTIKNAELILIGECNSSLCLYDRELGELRLFVISGLQLQEDNQYKIASLETLKDIFFSVSNYVDIIREKNETIFLVADEDYTVKIPESENKLGSGAYSDVYAGEFEGMHVAIKTIKATKKPTNIRFELVVMLYIQQIMAGDGKENDFIVRCYGAGKRYSVRDLIFEFMPSTLKDYILSSSYDPALLYTYFCDVISALEYLHRRCKVLHGDIKPANIFIGTSARLGDFGLSDCAEFPWRRPLSVGTPVYMAPEIMSDRSTSSTVKSDIYSLGVTIVHAITKVEPYAGVKTFQELVFKVAKLGIKPHMPSDVVTSQPKLALASMWCIESCPIDRPTATQMKNEFSTPRSAISQKLGIFSRAQPASANDDTSANPSKKRALI